MGEVNAATRDVRPSVAPQLTAAFRMAPAPQALVIGASAAHVERRAATTVARGRVRSLRWHHVLLAGVAMVGCFNLAGDWSADEVSRVASPGGNADAVLFEENGGATTSYAYSVYIVPRGRAIDPRADSAAATFYDVTRSDSAYGVNLRWRDSSTLYLEYLYSHRTRVAEPFVKVGPHAVHLVLRKEVVDTHAPSGGMLWNLRGRPH